MNRLRLAARRGRGVSGRRPRAVGAGRAWPPSWRPLPPQNTPPPHRWRSARPRSARKRTRQTPRRKNRNQKPPKAAMCITIRQGREKEKVTPHALVGDVSHSWASNARCWWRFFWLDGDLPALATVSADSLSVCRAPKHCQRLPAQEGLTASASAALADSVSLSAQGGWQRRRLPARRQCQPLSAQGGLTGSASAALRLPRRQCQPLSPQRGWQRRRLPRPAASASAD